MLTTITLQSRLADPSLLTTECLVAGEWIGGETAAFDVVSPSTGNIVASVPSLGACLLYTSDAADE